MTPRISRMLERAWLSTNVGWNIEMPANDPADSSVIQSAKWYANRWKLMPIAISDDEQLVAHPPHIQFGQTPPPPQSFGRQSWSSWNLDISDGAKTAFAQGYLSYAGNHTTIDYATILDIGFHGLQKHIDVRLAQLQAEEPTATDKADFLRGLRTVADGYIAFCARYAALACEQADSCTDPARAEELRVIAANCTRVIAEPPRSFHEACQAMWFSFFFLPDAPGRVDMLLAPYYQRDLANGQLSRDEAKELLSELWIKYFTYNGADLAVSAYNHLTLGGVQADGSDASGELTDLCLEVIGDLKIHRPQVGLRWHPAMPDERLRAAVRLWRLGIGGPDLCNDAQIVPALVRVGVSLADARDFSLSGCQEVIVSGKAQMGSVEGFLNLPKVLRLALDLEPESAVLPPAQLTSFADMLARFEQAMEWLVALAHEGALARDISAANDPMLPASLAVHDCIEKARGYTQGGARYNFCNWNAIGLANVTDALMAIKQQVFDEEQVTLPELRAALASSWDGFTDLRQRMRRAPAFGNDQDEVDELASRIVTRLDALFQQYTPFRGGSYILGTTAGGENMHIEFGRVTGATADGRRDGDTLVDSIGAVQGRDIQGVTALLNSVAKLPHFLLPTATTLNVKLEPKILATEEGVAMVAQLIRAHFLSGGQHFQVNLVDRETLLDARAHPELHQNLLVRVAGYSAQFVSLWDDLQEEIISRTGHVV